MSAASSLQSKPKLESADSDYDRMVRELAFAPRGKVRVGLLHTYVASAGSAYALHTLHACMHAAYVTYKAKDRTLARFSARF